MIASGLRHKKMPQNRADTMNENEASARLMTDRFGVA